MDAMQESLFQTHSKEYTPFPPAYTDGIILG